MVHSWHEDSEAQRAFLKVIGNVSGSREDLQVTAPCLLYEVFTVVLPILNTVSAECCPNIAETVRRRSWSLDTLRLCPFGTLVNLSSPNSAFTEPVSSLEGVTEGVSDAEGSAPPGSTAPPAAPAPEVPGEMEKLSSAMPWEEGEKDQEPWQPVGSYRCGGTLSVPWWREWWCGLRRSMAALCTGEEGAELCLPEESDRSNRFLTRQPELSANGILARLKDVCTWGYTLGHMGTESGLNRAKGGW